MLGTYGMCAEGFDVPEIDTLVLASPRRDVAQAVGGGGRHGRRAAALQKPGRHARGQDSPRVHPVSRK